MMKEMAKMDMRMGAPAMKFNPLKEDPYKLKAKWGMQMDGKTKRNRKGMGLKCMIRLRPEPPNTEARYDPRLEMSGMDMFAEYNYDYLKALERNTSFSTDQPIKEVLLNLTGNMWRYIWSINGVPLSEADKIKIEKGQVVHITLNNLTMMHHPMHLHGHFFRVINENGERSPLKHTVNVPPMQQVTIEFDANETGDWFFHCHILYHLVGGMARVYSYGTPRDPRMTAISRKRTNSRNQINTILGDLLDLASHMSTLNLVTPTPATNSISLQNTAGIKLRKEKLPMKDTCMTISEYLQE